MATQSQFVLDNVSIEVSSSALPQADFAVAQPGAANQVASAYTQEPLQEFSVLAVPFGTQPTIENLPPAQAGAVSQYLDALANQAAAQQDENLFVSPVPAPIKLFGQDAQGIVSVYNHTGLTGDAVPIAIAEYVAEAGNRLWVVRISHQQNLQAGQFSLETLKPFLDLVADTALSSDSVDVPTSLSTGGQLDDDADSRRGQPPDSVAKTASMTARTMPERCRPIDGPGLPTPPWWNGQFDSGHFPGSFRLGASYRNVLAIGPKNSFVQVNFQAPAPNVQQLEWQCAEICKRFLFQAYNIPPYSAHGYQMVTNYPAQFLNVKHRFWINNPGSPPAPLPNDVLAYGLKEFGHTSICVDTCVGSDGNGYIVIMEQNNDPSGWQQLPVINWEVKGSIIVTRYLHELPREPVEDFGRCLFFVGRLFNNKLLYAEEPFRAIWIKPHLQDPSKTGRTDVKSRCGLALTSALDEFVPELGETIKVQYFEYVRMEKQAAQPNARIGGLGRKYIDRRIADGNPVPPGVQNMAVGSRLFPETNNWVGGEFLALFNSFGAESISVCGFPLTGEVQEGAMTAQYFENVKMEKDVAGPARLARLGTEYATLVDLI